MADQLSCVQCLQKHPSHHCPVYEGDDLGTGNRLCIFCIDGVDCPPIKRAKANGGAHAPSPTTRSVASAGDGRAAKADAVAAPRIPLSVQELRGDVRSALKNLGYKTGQANRAAAAAQGEDFDSLLRSAMEKIEDKYLGTEPSQAPIPTATPEEPTMKTHKCEARDCDKQVPGRKRYCSSVCNQREWLKRKKENAGEKVTTRKSGNKAARVQTSEPRRTEKNPPQDRAPRFQIEVTELHLDTYLASLPVERKLAIVQQELAEAGLAR